MFPGWTRFRWVLPPAKDAAERALVRLLDRFPDALLPRVVEGILHGPPALRNFVAGWIPETASRRQALCAAWKTRLQQEPHDPAAWLALRLLDPSAAKAMWVTAVAAAGTLHEWKFLMRQTPESISGAEFYAVWKPHLPRLPWTLRRVFWQVSLTDPPGGTAWEDHLCETIRTESSVRVLEVLAAGVHASTSSPILLPVWKRRLAEERIRPVARRALRNILQHGCPLPESSGLVWTQWQQSWSREDADYRELLTYHLLDNWGQEAPVPETFPPENLWMPAVFRTLHANGPAPDDWQPFTLGERTPPDPEKPPFLTASARMPQRPTGTTSGKPLSSRPGSATPPAWPPTRTSGSVTLPACPTEPTTCHRSDSRPMPAPLRMNCTDGTPTLCPPEANPEDGNASTRFLMPNAS